MIILLSLKRPKIFLYGIIDRTFENSSVGNGGKSQMGKRVRTQWGVVANIPVRTIGRVNLGHFGAYVLIE